MQPAPNLDARTLGALFGEGYYHGVNSGYPAAGYESEHASWGHWIAHLAATCGRGGRWLDLGCAYGYLVAEAAAGGFRPVGIDVSAYALGRARTDVPRAHGRLARGFLEALPFADATCDVVSAFDVLEHLVDPDPALHEVRRVLRPGGVLIGATPDPLRFPRREATHFSERPPSFWIDRLLALGFAVDFRFFQAPYNLEWLAVRGDGGRLVADGRLRCDGFDTVPELGRVRGPEADRVAMRPRLGIAAAGADQPAAVRWLEGGEALVYVLVAGRAPVTLAAELEVSAPGGSGELTLALDDQRLGAFSLDRAWRVLTPPPLLLAAGGHHLRLTSSAALFVRRLELSVHPAAREDLLVRLPFDLYQRYDQCRRVVARLPGATQAILDVGGVLGGDGGHLATTGDFFPAAASPLSLDVRPSDHPDHRAASAGAGLPYPGDSFDVVLCQDVLEHVPPTARDALLAELTRVSRRFILLAAPFATPGVGDADALLFALIRTRHGYEHTFLAEHLAHGHPDLARTVSAFERRGATVVVLPNGYLPYWTLMQVANLCLAEPAMGERYASAQALYNGRVADWREPAYRHLLIVDLQGATDWCAQIRALMPESSAWDGDTGEGGAATVLNQILERVRATGELGPSVPPLAPGEPCGEGVVARAGARERVRPVELERIAARAWAQRVDRCYALAQRALRRLVWDRRPS